MMNNLKNLYEKYQSIFVSSLYVVGLILAGLIGNAIARLPQPLSSCNFKALDQVASPEAPEDLLKLFKSPSPKK